MIMISKKKVTGLYLDKAFFHGLGISTSRKDKETITDYVLDITKDFFYSFKKISFNQRRKQRKSVDIEMADLAVNISSRDEDERWGVHNYRVPDQKFSLFHYSNPSKYVYFSSQRK